MRTNLVIIILFFSLIAQAELIHESSMTLSGHNPEKWGLKHIKTQRGDGYFNFNELVGTKTTTEKMSKKKYAEKRKLILNLENRLSKNLELDTMTCSRKLIVESKQKSNLKISHIYCLENLPAKDLALITKTIKQFKN